MRRYAGLVEYDGAQHWTDRVQRTIDIEEFVDLADIDPVFYDSAYLLAPDKATTKPYALLARAMEESGKVGIARVAGDRRPGRRARQPRRPRSRPRPTAAARVPNRMGEIEQFAAVDTNIERSQPL